MKIKTGIGWAMAIIAIGLIVVVVIPQFTGSSIPILLGVSSETTQMIIDRLIATVVGVLFFGATYLITDGTHIGMGIFGGMFVAITLILISVCSVQERADQSGKETTEYSTVSSEGTPSSLGKEATEYSTEMSEYVDPDTGVHYWVQEDVGMTPRLNPDGTIMVTPQD